MKPENEIIKQLEEQNIEYELLQDEYLPSKKSELNKVIKIWIDRFIGKHSAPNLENYLWHIFSKGATDSLEGEDAVKELKSQYDTDTLIFNEPQQYLIKCKAKIPLIEMEDFLDDIYISHHNMKWTFVIPHETPEIGPFFSCGIKSEK